MSTEQTKDGLVPQQNRGEGVANTKALTQAGSALEAQLREGNAGAQGYFTKRVDIYLRSGDDHSLAAFMRGFWASYKIGVERLWREARDRDRS